MVLHDMERGHYDEGKDEVMYLLFYMQSPNMDQPVHYSTISQT